MRFDAFAPRARRVIAPFLIVCALLASALISLNGAQATDFPPLTGRVVDAANILSPVTRADLEGKLAALEAKSSIQLVVATVPSLGGQEIAAYANDLGRFWKIGETKKNNGVLLLVAPKEHRVWIAVGYGLEGVLTDAVSSVIVSNAITPRLKAGDYDGGVARGVDDIITALTSDTTEWKPKPPQQDANAGDPFSWLPFLIWVAIVLLIIFGRGRMVGPVIYSSSILGSSMSRGGGFSGSGVSGGGFSGGGGGGFSGGGGSFGGGGAGGSW